MKAINNYYVRQLTAEEIAVGEHRNFVGGFGGRKSASCNLNF
jgi:hypothetical protein